MHVAKLIVLDSTGQYIRLLEAAPRGSRVVVRRMATLALPHGPDTPVDEFQAKIRDALAEHAKSGATVIGLIGRTSAVLRDLRLPDAPEDELPGIVQFQAIRELTFPIEQAAIDYDVVGPPDADGQRRVLLAALQQDVVDRCRTAVSAAGLSLGRLGLRPYATWRAYRQLAVAPDLAVLVVSLAGEFLELTVARGDSVLFTRATMVKQPAEGKSAEPAAALVGEVRRTLAAFANQVPGVTVERVALAAGATQHEAAGTALAAALAIPVDRFDPFQAAELACDPVDDPGSYVAAIGAALAAHEPWAIDFLNPKKPIVRRDRRKPMALAAAAAVIVMIAGSYGMIQLKLASGRKQIARLAESNTKLQQNVKAGNDIIRKSMEVERWLKSGVDCLGTLQRLTEQHPDTREMFTASVTISHENSPNGAARISLDSYAKDSRAIGKFYSNLREGERYTAEPSIGVVGIRDGRSGSDYKVRFPSQISERPEKGDAAGGAESPLPGDSPIAGKSASRTSSALDAARKAKPATNRK
jgi:Tfp pilus assembly PilM family ATPase